LYALSTLKDVPVLAERVANKPVPDAGDVRALNAIPLTCFALREALLVGPVPKVNTSTVLIVESPDTDHVRLDGVIPNEERAWFVKLIIGI
jgi:hypothetical protein